MKKKLSVLACILAGIALGGALGALLPGWGIRALNTFRGMFLDFVKFLVPLIILSFIIPAIADAGKGAGRMLFLAIGLAYALTFAAGVFSFASSSLALPYLVSGGGGMNAVQVELPAYFRLSLPPVLGIGTSLVLAVLMGIGIIVRDADAVLSLVKQFRSIVSWILSGVVMPMLPFYVMSVVADITAKGSLVAMGHSFAALMAFCVVMTLIVVVVQYAVAGFITGRNPIRAIANMLPAYFTGLGCCSSAATMPVTLQQTVKNGVSPVAANLTIPICANMHLSGSICNMVAYSIGMLVLAGKPISFVAFAQFILQASVIAVAGVPGGMVLASSAIAENLLGITSDWYAMIIAIYMVLDGVGTACNVVGSGAIAMIVDRFRGGEIQSDRTIASEITACPFGLAHAASR